MQKRNLCVIVGLFLINFVSAADFSLGNFFDSIDSSTMMLGFVFIVSFALLFFALSKVFKDQYGEPNTSIAGVISLAVSLLITYGINETGFDIQGFFFEIGIPEDILAIALPIIILGGIIFLFWKFKKNALFILGGFFLLTSFVVYEKGAMIALGITLIVIGGIWSLIKSRGGGNYDDYGSSYGGPGRLKRGYDTFKKWRDPRNRLKKLKNKNEFKKYQRKSKKKELKRARKLAEKQQQNAEAETKN